MPAKAPEDPHHFDLMGLIETLLGAQGDLSETDAGAAKLIATDDLEPTYNASDLGSENGIPLNNESGLRTSPASRIATPQQIAEALIRRMLANGSLRASDSDEFFTNAYRDQIEDAKVSLVSTNGSGVNPEGSDNEDLDEEPLMFPQTVSSLETLSVEALDLARPDIDGIPDDEEPTGSMPGVDSDRTIVTERSAEAAPPSKSTSEKQAFLTETQPVEEFVQPPAIVPQPGSTFQDSSPNTEVTEGSGQEPGSRPDFVAKTRDGRSPAGVSGPYSPNSKDPLAFGLRLSTATPGNSREVSTQTESMNAVSQSLPTSDAVRSTPALASRGSVLAQNTSAFSHQGNQPTDLGTTPANQYEVVFSPEQTFGGGPKGGTQQDQDQRGAEDAQSEVEMGSTGSRMNASRPSPEARIESEIVDQMETSSGRVVSTSPTRILGGIAPSLEQGTGTVGRPMGPGVEGPAMTAEAAEIVKSTASSPAAQISVRISPPGQAPLDVRVAQRAGQVQVAVRTADSGTQVSLRRDLSSLVGSLETHGFRTDAVITQEPGLTAKDTLVQGLDRTLGLQIAPGMLGLGANSAEAGHQDSQQPQNQGQQQEQHRQQREQQRQNQQQSGQQSLAAWMEMMESETLEQIL